MRPVATQLDLEGPNCGVRSSICGEMTLGLLATRCACRRDEVSTDDNPDRATALPDVCCMQVDIGSDL